MTLRAIRLVAACLAAAGCARPGAEPIPPLFAATGAVARDGEPVKSGGLIFLPEPPRPGGLTVNANVNSDGTFALETSRPKPGGGLESYPGAPAGSYKASYHPDSDGSRMGLDYIFPDPVTVNAAPSVVKLTLPREMPTGSAARTPPSGRTQPTRR